jgi:2-oxoglutarate ferredoxin oxidoreductase subunit alpha
MALGCAYMGKRTAVGTSGGGFSLMVEGLGLSGQAELPVVVVYGQRAGPSTGMPTYSAQTDLLFVLSAGHGEFPRFVVAPGDVSEAFYWSGMALNLAWKFQIPAFVLTEKDFCLGAFSFDQRILPEVVEEPFSNWDGLSTYRRYEVNESGVSPQIFPPVPGQVIKTNSYVHDEDGITSESPEVAKGIADKRIRKFNSLASELADKHTVNVSGNGDTALLCWGYTKGVCMELASYMKVKVIQPIVLSPFPAAAVREALAGVTQVITVECNTLGQLSILLRQNGFKVDHEVQKYDGRSFSIEELENEIKKVMA